MCIRDSFCAVDDCHTRVYRLVDHYHTMLITTQTDASYKTLLKEIQDIFFANEKYQNCFIPCSNLKEGVLRPLLQFLQQSSSSDVVTQVRFIQQTVLYFVETCGHNRVVPPDTLEENELKRAHCPYIRPLYDMLQETRGSKLLFEALNFHFDEGEEGTCFKGDMKTFRFLLNQTQANFTKQNPDLNDIRMLWSFLVYTAVNVIKETAINPAGLRLCDEKLQTIKEFLHKPAADAFKQRQQARETLKTMVGMEICFKQSEPCSSHTFSPPAFGEYLSSSNEKRFSNSWELQAFHFGQFINTCYVRRLDPRGGRLWKAVPTFEDADCAKTIGAVSSALQSSEIETFNDNTGASTIVYIEQVLNRKMDKCFNKTVECDRWREWTRFFLNGTVGVSKTWANWSINESMLKTYRIARQTALKAVMNCSGQDNSDDYETSEYSGVNCTSFLEKIKVAIEEGRPTSNVNKMRDVAYDMIPKFRECIKAQNKAQGCWYWSDTLNRAFEDMFKPRPSWEDLYYRVTNIDQRCLQKATYV
eukprot:TRINITY_DN11119_c0_g1_i1.p1 TRINITY_DN11119_c0_g1~~TRINITY_DN11119_c0_g1_i1.p1  ORF type:complete len:576 (-),score=99.30 TRINITY_DN11119_c0_g1_i1:255-1844(-)